jgi:hypothetical protein
MVRAHQESDTYCPPQQVCGTFGRVNWVSWVKVDGLQIAAGKKGTAAVGEIEDSGVLRSYY